MPGPLPAFSLAGTDIAAHGLDRTKVPSDALVKLEPHLTVSLRDGASPSSLDGGCTGHSATRLRVRARSQWIEDAVREAAADMKKRVRLARWLFFGRFLFGIGLALSITLLLVTGPQGQAGTAAEPDSFDLYIPFLAVGLGVSHRAC